MTDRPPSVEPTIALAALLLAVGALALAAVGPAGATPVGVEDPTENTTTTAEDTTGTVSSTTDDVTSTTEETTSTVDGTDDGATSTTDVTAATVEETAGTVTTTLNATAGSLESTASIDATALSLADDGLVETVTGATSSLTTGDSREDPTSAESVPSSSEDTGNVAPQTSPNSAHTVDTRASRVVPDRGVDPSGTDGQNPPLSAGTLAVTGVLVGGVAVRGVGALRNGPGRPGLGARASARAVADQARARWHDWAHRLAGLFGYQRYDDSDPLDHDTRVALYDAIDSADGRYLAELSRETDVPLSTARYHLRILEYEGLVSSAKHRGKRHYATAPDEPSAIHAALEEDGPAAVIEALAREAPVTVSGLAEAIDRDVSTVTHHLQRLDQEGIVERERKGGAVMNRLSPSARAALRSPARRHEKRAVADD